MALVLIILVIGPLVAARKASENVTPGSEPAHDYENPLYRLHRTHANAVENLGGFAIPAILAMLLGISPAWVNGLIWLTVLLRLAYSYVYLANLGKPAQGIRTFTYVAAWAVNVLLVIMVIWAAF